MKQHWTNFILRAYLIMALIFVFAPAISLVFFSFQEGKIQSFPIEAYSTRWYKEAWENPVLREGFRNSVLVSTVVSLVSVVFGFLGAHLLCRRRPKGQLFYVAFVSLPVVIPLLLSGIAFLIFFQQIHIVGTLWAIIIAHICFSSPFALALIRNPYERLNIELEQAAYNLGASPIGVIFRIVIPQLWPVLIAAGLLCFLVSWDEFILAWFVGGFTKTLPVVIYGMMGTSFNPSLNAVGTLSIGISSVLLFSIFVFKSISDYKARGS
jgi:spermidine/putrescine transport system permease protein